MIAIPAMAAPHTGQDARAQGLFVDQGTTPLNLVLVSPQIPPNTGNAARMCAVTGTRLHLVAPLGFRLDEKDLRRAGLDYWNKVHAATWGSFDELCEAEKLTGDRVHLFTAHATKGLWSARFRPGDWLVLGHEQKGLSGEVLARFPESWLRVPMIREPTARSLNLATCAGIVVYEALRQINLAQSG